jgi:hypothetical protein
VGVEVNRDDLDAWFARAEDVLTDWTPDPELEPDVMVAAAPAEGADDDLPALADSYYDQEPYARFCGPDCPVCAQPFIGLYDEWARALLAVVERVFPVNTEWSPWSPAGLGWEPVGQTTDPAPEPRTMVDRPLTAAQAALEARRNRNTGPRLPVPGFRGGRVPSGRIVR